MWRASKEKDAETHPRRQIMVNGDKVYKMFFKSTDYLAFKEKMLKEDSSFADPGRTTSLATRCGCLGGSLYVVGTTHHVHHIHDPYV